MPYLTIAKIISAKL
ncbi:uncharacterized protein FFM5_15358 [Fusarium fujikuroi]|nr:uncharacterized protein FFM5_15358 [Fusarium fujikuroi]